jgi:hypothetical protein
MAVSDGNGLGKVSEISSHPANILWPREMFGICSTIDRCRELFSFETGDVNDAFGG